MKIIDAVFEELQENPIPVPIKKTEKNDRITFHDIALFAFGIGLMVFSRFLFTYLTYRG